MGCIGLVDKHNFLNIYIFHPGASTGAEPGRDALRGCATAGAAALNLGPVTAAQAHLSAGER